MTDPGIPETEHYKTTLDPRAHELQVRANDALARLAKAETALTASYERERQARAECERLRDAHDLAGEAAMELDAAMLKFDPFNSPHEGWAVIKEELDELWEHVCANTGRDDEARKEAIQIAAMALRYANDLCARSALGEADDE